MWPLFHIAFGNDVEKLITCKEILEKTLNNRYLKILTLSFQNSKTYYLLHFSFYSTKSG